MEKYKLTTEGMAFYDKFKHGPWIFLRSVYLWSNSSFDKPVFYHFKHSEKILIGTLKKITLALGIDLE